MIINELVHSEFKFNKDGNRERCRATFYFGSAAGLPPLFFDKKTAQNCPFLSFRSQKTRFRSQAIDFCLVIITI